EAIEEAKRRLRRYLEEHGSVTASDAKSILDSTRKYSIPFLEHLDREGFTVRKGDVRVLRAAPPGS
ncbi:MAG TPA: SelB C-terminal domain-containing protein, partial [Planctomycetota bacterium]|nr:SelB C-terminal domain-containing protein [Planctomycetota bacterium]